MHNVISACYAFLQEQYRTLLDTPLLAEDGEGPRWRLVSAENLQVAPTSEEHQVGVIQDDEIGILLFLIPYKPGGLESQINQALKLRSLLLPDRNYTGREAPGIGEDPYGPWRVVLHWLVPTDRKLGWTTEVMNRRR